MKRLVEEYLGFDVLRSKIERLQNVGSASSLVSVDASQMIVVGVVAVETTRSEQNSERGDGDRLSLSALIGMEECEQTTFLGAFPPLGAFTLGFLGGTPCFGAAFWQQMQPSSQSWRQLPWEPRPPSEPPFRQSWQRSQRRQ